MNYMDPVLTLPNEEKVLWNPLIFGLLLKERVKLD